MKAIAAVTLSLRILPLLYFFCPAPDARPLGTCLGTFTVGTSRSAAKRAAAPLACQNCGAWRVNILVDSAFSPAAAAARGWRFVCRVGAVATVEGPRENIADLSNVPGVRYVKIPVPVTRFMDSVRTAARADKVVGPAAFSGLPRSFTGKNVLVGVIDVGFDTHHAAFLDSSGKTRFIGVWDQEDNTGAFKNRFRYGTIKIGAALQADSNLGLSAESHGTHVANIAGGGDRSVPYWGIAPEVKLIGVKHGAYDNQIIDGMKWIFSIADSLHLPCVINLSMGVQNGPHDGTSLIDRAIDSLSGPGKIVVGAAGNNGDKNIHAQLTLGSAAQSAGALLSSFDPSNPQSWAFTIVDIWGQAGNNFRSSVVILDTTTLNYYQGNKPLNTQTPSVFGPDTTLVGGSDFVILEGQSERASALNGKPHLELVLYTRNPHFALGVQLTGAGTVHLWNFSEKPLKSFGLPGWIDGDVNYTAAEIGGTAKRIITVGAFATKVAFKKWDADTFFYCDVPGKIGTLAPFSSHGPTVDGRNKPDISAPGSITVTSAMSHAAVGDTAGIIIWPAFPDLHNRYYGTEGTSQAAPVVAGVVALMLEADAGLTPETIKAVLQQTAKQDQYTGALAAPDNLWGAGKIDALAAVAKVLNVTLATARRPALREPSPAYISTSGNVLIIRR
ncbi:MAG: S8 family serine peptidase, partial [Chitinivibrionales bacterium]|nr:S8 family serine peptidase [Chitinivibrionales bacterium]